VFLTIDLIINHKILYPSLRVSLSKLDNNPKSKIYLYFSYGSLENLMHSSKNRIYVNRSAINSGSFETSLLVIMKLIVDLMNEDM
jgi:hypothetical protein